MMPIHSSVNLCWQRCTVKSGEALKVITVRTTSFEAVAADGGSAAVEAVGATGDAKRPLVSLSCHHLIDLN